MARITLAVAPGSVHTPPPSSVPIPAPVLDPPVKKRVPTQEELERVYPSLTHLAGPPSIASKRAWIAVFNTHPDAMHALLADYIRQVHAKPGRIGQRPMPREEEVDLEDLIYGQGTEQPLADVLARSVKVSARMFCQQSGISRSQYQRILTGQYEPTVHEMRMIAKAIRRSPTYFVEYRKAMAVAAFINLVNDRPGIATSIYRNYLEVRV